MKQHSQRNIWHLKTILVFCVFTVQKVGLMLELIWTAGDLYTVEKVSVKKVVSIEKVVIEELCKVQGLKNSVVQYQIQKHVSLTHATIH